jgi:ABC-type transport system involved in multi-copper enzyme maturation permease subunit
LLIVLVFAGAEGFVNKIMHNAGKNSPIVIPDFSLYSFPYVWHNLAYLAGFFKIFPALIIIIFVTNEFSYKTIRQNVMAGLSRNEFLLSKVIFVLLFSLASALVLFLSAFFLGMTHTNQITSALIFQKMYFVPAYFLELFTFSLFAMMIAFLVKKQGLSIGVLALYFYVIEPLAAYKMPDDISKYLPVKTIGRLIDIPNSSLMKLFGVNFREYVATTDVVLCLVYALLFVFVVKWVLQKSDI